MWPRSPELREILSRPIYMDFLTCDVWCICLEENKARYKSSLAEFRKVGLGDRVRYHRPKRDPRGGRVGCWLSHVACLKKSLRRKQPYVLVFEDDVTFVDGWREQIPVIRRFLAEEPRWDIFRIGALFEGLYGKSHSNSEVWRARSLGNHGYFMSTDCIMTLLRDPVMMSPEVHPDLHIDQYWGSLDLRDYSLTSPICYQRGDLLTDNDWNIWGQGLVQNEYVYEPYQKLNNSLKWQTRWLPTSWQLCFQVWHFGLLLLIMILLLFAVINCPGPLTTPRYASLITGPDKS